LQIKKRGLSAGVESPLLRLFQQEKAMKMLWLAGINYEKMKEKREKFPALLEKNKTIWYDKPVT